MKVLVILTFLTLFTWTQGKPQKDCELRKSAEGIEVYTCKTADSKINSIQSSFILDAPLSTLAEALLDWKNFHQWQYKIRKTEMLKSISKDEFIYRAELDAPWPVADRDMILHVKMAPSSKPGEYLFSTIGIPDFIPPKEGFIRVPVSEGHWKIKVVGKDQLEIQHSLSVDPGGVIPTWLLNLSLAEGPFETYTNLRERLKSSQ